MWSSDDPHDTYNNLVGRAMPGYDIYHRFGPSSVFGAFSWKLNKDVALKILTMGDAANPLLVKAFARQNKGLAQPPPDANLVPVHAVGKVSELVMAIMERVRGESVARLVARNGPLTWKCALEISMEVARALRIAQDLGLPDHRLHPERLLLSMDGNVHVSLCCLPRPLAPGEPPIWAHLEDLRGEPATEASDVYVVGMLLFYLATGTPPFTGEDVEKITNAQLWAKPDFARLSALGVPPSFIKVAERALAKHPNDRYPSPSILMAGMKSVLNNDAPGYVLGSYREVIAQLVRDEQKDAEEAAAAAAEAEAEPESGGGRGSNRAGRRGSLSGGRRPSLVARKTGGAAVMSPSVARATPPGMRQMRPAPKSSLPLILGISGGVLVVILVLAFALLSGGPGSPAVADDPPPPPPTKNGRDPRPDKPVDPIEDPPETDPEKLYARADQHDLRGQTEAAIRIFSDLIAKDPAFKDATWRRAKLYHGIGELQKALDDINHHLGRHPEDLNALLLRAQIYESQGMFGQAIEAFGEVIQRDPNHMVALERRARLHEKRSDWAGAAADFHVLISKGVERPDVVQARAQAFDKAVWDLWGRVNATPPPEPRPIAEALDRLFQVGLDAPLLRISRAIVLMWESNPQSDQIAASHLDRAIARYNEQTPVTNANPERGMAFSYRVVIQVRAKRPEQALLDARSALGNAVADSWAAETFRRLSEAFVAIDPPRAKVYALLGVAMAGYGPEHEQALAQFLQENPDISLDPPALSAYVEPGALLVLGAPSNWAQGIQRGDRVLAYNGQPVRTIWELRRAIVAGAGAGRATLRVQRQGQEGDLQIPAGQWPVTLGVGMTIK